MLNRGAVEAKKAREARGWSNREMGRQLGIAEAYAWQIEVGKRTPERYSDRERFRVVLGIDPSWWDLPNVQESAQ